MSKKINLFSHFKSDFASGLVVFLVALPLCLGIAMASGAPLFSGIISGVIGGVVVGFLSQSHISVSGPAAGLTAIVLTAITDLGSFNLFLTAVFIAGIIQLILGYIKAGTISNFFPTNVIEGMLAGIGIIIIMKQLPHAIGFDSDFEGDQSFLQSDGNNSILKRLKLIPGALVAVVIGIIINELFIRSGSHFAIGKEHLVSLPAPASLDDFQQIIVFPDFTGIMNQKVWLVGITIAIVASIETLLCIEAADRMDVHKRYTDTNVELKAQGIGNILSSLIGGLPMTSVVVRSSANSTAGAKSKLSAIIHGVLLFVSVITIPLLLNKIPLATLAAVLLLVGYKLAKPATFIHFWKKGKYQFIPFIATLIAVVFTDLLKGVVLGMIISIIFVLKGNLKRAYVFRKEEYIDGDVIHIDLAQEVSFLNKADIKETLKNIPNNSKVIIDASDTVYIAHDILDLIHEFKTIRAKENSINVQIKGFKKTYQLENSEENHVTIEHYYDALKRKMVEKKVGNFK